MNLAITKLRTVLKIAAIYVFAMTTAVACGKFETGRTKIGTTNGTANLTNNGVPGPNLSIDKVTPNSSIISGEISWTIKVNVTHGTRTMEFLLYPTTNPSQQDGMQKTIGTTDYIAQAVCGDESCGRYAVLVNARDVSNGIDKQRVQYWDTWTNQNAPVFANDADTDFGTVSQVFETFSGTAL